MNARFILPLALVAGAAFAASCRNNDAHEMHAAAVAEGAYVLDITGMT